MDRWNAVTISIVQSKTDSVKTRFLLVEKNSVKKIFNTRSFKFVEKRNQEVRHANLLRMKVKDILIRLKFILD